MIRRALKFATIAGAVVGVPYVASEWPKLKANVSAMVDKSPFGSGSTAARPVSSNSTTPVYPASASNDPRIFGATPPSDEPPIVDMGEVFRFDRTPTWVLAQWPRVSAGLAEDSLHGMRVALITGLRPDDMAGSLTYYFTPAQRCSKITFSGATGDPRRFTELLTQRFGFKPEPSTEPGVLRYEIRWNGTPQSEYLIRTAAVVRSATPLTRYEVQLVVIDSSAH